MMAWVDRHGETLFVLGGNETSKRLKAAGGISVDEDALELCKLMHWPYVELPALWSTRLRAPDPRGRSPGSVRNGELVEWVAQAPYGVFLAFPCPRSVGTWNCRAQALSAGIAVHTNWSLVPNDPRRHQ